MSPEDAPLMLALQTIGDLQREIKSLHRSLYQAEVNLAALERVLAVSSSLNSYEGEEEEEESAFPFRGAAEAEAEPIFSPIPFLHQGSENTEAAQRAETAAQRPVPADDQAVYRVPDGRVDELDTADAQESHGGVADEVQPMSAATSLPEEKESLAKRQRSSDV